MIAAAELLAELDRLTASMETADPTEWVPLAALLERRAELVGSLSERPEELGEAARDTLERARAAGERLLDRMRVARAARRGERGRLYRSGCLLRALAAERGPGPPRVNCRG